MADWQSHQNPDNNLPLRGQVEDAMHKITAMLLAGLLFWPLGLEAADGSRAPWQGAWGHPPTAHNELPPTVRPDGRKVAPLYAPLPAYRDVTVRQVIRLSAPARAIRLRFTNEFGGKALTIGAAHVALAGEDGAILAGTDHVITFAGKSSADLPPGAPLLGDTLTWSLPAFAKLAISIHY